MVSERTLPQIIDEGGRRTCGVSYRLTLPVADAGRLTAEIAEAAEIFLVFSLRALRSLRWSFERPAQRYVLCCAQIAGCRIKSQRPRARAPAPHVELIGNLCWPNFVLKITR